MTTPVAAAFVRSLALVFIFVCSVVCVATLRRRFGRRCRHRCRRRHHHDIVTTGRACRVHSLMGINFRSFFERGAGRRGAARVRSNALWVSGRLNTIKHFYEHITHTIAYHILVGVIGAHHIVHLHIAMFHGLMLMPDAVTGLAVGTARPRNDVTRRGDVIRSGAASGNVVGTRRETR